MSSNNPFTKFTASNNVSDNSAIPADSAQPVNTTTQSANPFEKFSSGNIDSAAPKQTDSKQVGGDSGAIMAGIDQVNRAFSSIADGTLAKVSEWAGAKKLQKGFESRAQSLEQEAATSAQQHPTTAAITGPLSDIAASAAFGGVALPGGGLLATSAKLGLLGGAQGYLGYAPTEDKRQENAAWGAGLSAAFPVAAKGLIAGAKDLGQQAVKGLGKTGEVIANSPLGNVIAAVGDDPMSYTNASKELIQEPGTLKKVFSPKQAAAQNLAMKVEQENTPPDLSNPVSSVKLTPAEQIGGENMRSFEKQAIVDDTTKGLINKRNQQITDQVNSNMKRVLDSMVPDGTEKAAEKVKGMYTGLGTLQLPKEGIESVLKNTTVKKEFDTIAKSANVTEDIQNSSPDSFARWNEIKKNLDDKIWAGNPNNPKTVQDTKNGLTSGELRAFEEARGKIINMMDTAYPQYAPARKLAEQLTVQNNYMKIVNKIKNTVGQVSEDGESSIDQLYNTFFKSSEQRNEFLKNVNRVGGDQENASKLINDLQHLYKSPTNILLSKSTGSASVYPRTTTGSGIVENIANRFVNGRYNKELIKLMLSTDTKWQDEVTKVMYDKSRPSRLLKLGTILNNFAKTQINRPTVKAATQSISRSPLGNTLMNLENEKGSK